MFTRIYGFIVWVLFRVGWRIVRVGQLQVHRPALYLHAGTVTVPGTHLRGILIEGGRDWLKGWLVGLLIRWFINMLIDGGRDWLIGWLVGWSIDWFVDLLIYWLIDWFIDRLIDLLFEDCFFNDRNYIL